MTLIFRAGHLRIELKKKESGMGVKQLFVSYKVPIFFVEKIAKTILVMLINNEQFSNYNQFQVPQSLDLDLR